MTHKCFNVDFETLGGPRDGKPILLDMSACVWDIDGGLPSYAELLKNTIQIKLDIRSQKEQGRVVNQSTKEWWSKQEERAQRVLKPGPNDRTITQAMTEFLDWLDGYYLDPRNTLAFCRGQSFDLPLLEGAIDDAGLSHRDPYKFWNQGDVRSYLKGLYADPRARKFALPKGWLDDNFVNHDSRCDVAKDAGLILYAQQLARGDVNPDLQNDVEWI